jgi:hypothetical protein
MAFELRHDDPNQQLLACGQLRWCNSIMFAAPADDNGRVYVRLHMGPMGTRSNPHQPICAHAGLVAPRKRLGYEWTLVAECALKVDDIPDGQWHTALVMQGICLRLQWAEA